MGYIETSEAIGESIHNLQKEFLVKFFFPMVIRGWYILL